MDHHRQEQTRVTNLQHELLRERKHLLAGQRRRKPARRHPRIHGCIKPFSRLGLQHLLQARPRGQRRGHQLVLQLCHGRRVQHAIIRVRLQELEQRPQLGRRRLPKRRKGERKEMNNAAARKVWRTAGARTGVAAFASAIVTGAP